MKVPVLLEELLLSAATANGALYPIKIWIMWSCLIDSTIVAFCSMNLNNKDKKSHECKLIKKNESKRRTTVTTDLTKYINNKYSSYNKINEF